MRAVLVGSKKKWINGSRVGRKYGLGMKKRQKKKNLKKERLKFEAALLVAKALIAGKKALRKYLKRIGQ